MKYIRFPFIAVLFILIVGVHPSRAEETSNVFKDFSIIDGVTPLRIVMKDEQQGFSTEFKITKLNYSVKIPDELFNPKLLSKAVDSPLWQAKKYLAITRGKNYFQKSGL